MEADFRVFYRVDNMYDLPAPTFFRLARRVNSYGGVMADRVAEQMAADYEAETATYVNLDPQVRALVDADSKPVITRAELAARFGHIVDVAKG